MIGDTLEFTDYHREAARRILPLLRPRVTKTPLVVTVAGESGSGKTGAAHCLAQALHEEEGLAVIVLSQDDYFRLPPISNHARRVEDLAWVGPGEVRLDLMGQHCLALCEEDPAEVVKPLIFYQENRIDEERVAAGCWDLVVAEGTYVTLLEEADFRAFIDHPYTASRPGRLARGREADDPFIEEVLAIEHRIISAHASRADVILSGKELIEAIRS